MSNKNKNGNVAKPMLANRIFKLRAWVRNQLMVNVVSIDFNNEFITWDDNQYDRCVPPNKCYEIETFDDGAANFFKQGHYYTEKKYSLSTNAIKKIFNIKGKIKNGRKNKYISTN